MSTLNIYLEGLFILLTLGEAKASKTSIPIQLNPIFLLHSLIKIFRKTKKTKKQRIQTFLLEFIQIKGVTKPLARINHNT